MHFKNKTILLYVTFYLIAICLSVIWSRGYLLAAGEEGLHLYNPLRSFVASHFFWLNTLSQVPVPFVYPRITFYAIVSTFQFLGLDSWLNQVIIHTLLITNALVWTYHLVRVLFPKKPKSTYIFSALFYLFNLYTMSQIWIRFLYPLIFLWSLFPLFLFLWIKWVESGKLKYLVFIAVTSVVFSEAYGITASALVLWIGAGVYFFLKIFTRDNIIRTLTRGILGLIIWLLINLWWLYPLVRMSNGAFASQTLPKDNISSLQAVSHSFPTSQIVFLMQKAFFNQAWPWFRFYSSPLVLTVMLGVVVVVILGIAKSINEKKWIFLILLLFIGWFISKGTNPPFGFQFYSIIFTVSPFLTIFRNSYEKAGLLLVLPYSVFFGLGIGYLKQRMHKFSLVILSAALFILVWPMWTGKLFLPFVRIDVPQYYNEANSYLNSLAPGKLFQLPFNHGDGTTYKWGFIGLDSSMFLYDKNSVSALSRFHIFDDLYSSLPDYFTERKFSNILALLGVSQIVLRNDIVSGDKGIDDYSTTKDFIQNWDNVIFKRTIGKLAIYSVGDPPSIVLAPVNIQYVDTPGFMFEKIVDPEFKIGKTAFIVSGQNRSLTLPPISSAPEISVKQLSAKYYVIRVNNARSPFVLVFNQTYDDLWVARTGDDTVGTHFIANGYANAWLVNKSGSFDIDLVFKIWPWE